MEKFYSIKELSKRLSIAEQTLYTWVHEEYIPHYKIGRLVRFNEQEVMDWLEKKRCNGRKSRAPEINLGE